MTTSAVLYDPQNATWLHFRDPVEIVRADTVDAVLPALRKVEACVDRQGLHAAGYLGYEAAPAFDPACRTAPPEAFPLLQFGLFEPPERITLPAPTGPPAPRNWSPAVDRQMFAAAVGQIRDAIARGETYQVNYTFALSSTLETDPWQLFLQMMACQPTPHAGYLDCGRWAISSASPELFFLRDGRQLTMRPMKGTRPRGLSCAEDRQQAADLLASAKDRAENIMILDMVRNDLGRLADTGSVRTEAVCVLEQYPSVWQLTSTIHAESEAPLAELFRALFPCASITGAPKPRTMQIINRLEAAPRHIYTGAFGWAAPGRRAHFSVAIRTALADRQQGRLAYGVGAGITWDSQADDEYDECLAKARLFERPGTDFELLETLRWVPGHGYFLLDEHLQRLCDSAEYFAIPCRRDAVETFLAEQSATFPAAPHRVRLRLSRSGTLQCNGSALPSDERSPVRLKLAAAPIDSHNVLLYHKTTQRQLYSQALEGVEGADDVLLWNRRGELTETTIANLVVERDGELLTPPVRCGLLPGTYRSALLKRGCIREQTLTRSDLQSCSRIFLVNALRKWRVATLVED